MFPNKPKLLLLVDRRGFEPRTPACKASVFPIIPTAQLINAIHNAFSKFADRSSDAGDCKQKADYTTNDWVIEVVTN